MPFKQILYQVDGPVATITLNRPEQMNALTKVLEAELRSAVEQAGRDHSVRAIVLTGAGRAFCAGMDMEELAVLPPEGSWRDRPFFPWLVQGGNRPLRAVRKVLLLDADSQPK